MIDSLVSSPTIQMLEQTLSFTEQRHQVLLEDIANASTPGFVQKDVSVAEFQKSLQEELGRKRSSFGRAFSPESSATLSFGPTATGGIGVTATATEVPEGAAFHDRSVHSMEYLMSQMADNAISHNMVAQFLKGKYDTIGRAISLKV
jgi:flagellar basal-body rod protein FlgB